MGYIMKKVILVLLCFTFVSWAFADELKIKGYIKPDPILGDGNFLIYNKDGNEKAKKPDLIWSSKSERCLKIDKNVESVCPTRSDPLRKG